MFADSDEVARAFRDDVARAIIMPGDVGSLLVNRVVRAREYSAFHVPITWPMPTWRVRECAWNRSQFAMVRTLQHPDI
jgi:hypothetical protein